MKLSLNGAITIGTLDGANVEIRERVGADNFFLFGMTAAQVMACQQQKDHAAQAIRNSPRLTRVLQDIESGKFSSGDKTRYSDLLNDLRNHDYFLVTSDFDAYYQAQRDVDVLFQQPLQWARMAALNTAKLGWFSSDRTIASYAQKIWNVTAMGDAGLRDTA